MGYGSCKDRDKMRDETKGDWRKSLSFRLKMRQRASKGRWMGDKIEGRG